MKCSHAHECCDRHQMSWQRPTVSTDHHLPHTHMSTCTHIAVGRDMHSMQCVSRSACNLTHSEWIVHSAINALLHTFSFLTNPKGIFLSAGFSQLMMKKIKTNILPNVYCNCFCFLDIISNTLTKTRQQSILDAIVLTWKPVMIILKLLQTPSPPHALRSMHFHSLCLSTLLQVCNKIHKRKNINDTS